MSSAQKKAVAAHRQRIARKGLARIEVQVPRADIDRIKRIAKVLREEGAGAGAIRSLVGNSAPLASLTGADMIAAMSIRDDVDFPVDAFERRRDFAGAFPREVEL